MSLSTSRQQFLAYETNNPEEIHYERKGGIFVSTCVCITFIFVAVIVAALVGVIVYYITYFKLSQNTEIWDDTFGFPTTTSTESRLSEDIVPKFYRLKLIADVDNQTFNGEVYITIKATKQTKKIILHAKDLRINVDAKLTEQVYEVVSDVHSVRKREVSNTTDVEITNTTETVNSTSEASVSSNVTLLTEEPKTTEASITIPTTLMPEVNTTEIPVVDTQFTHSNVKKVKIISIEPISGDRIVISLANALRTGVDYTLELTFQGKISNSLNGFYMSSYLDSDHKTRPLAVTQFEPVSARAAFPCFDEPQLKAKFEISIAHSKNFSALSNMNVASVEDMPEKPNWQWTHFERSVNMSTYLVAYVLSDFKSAETSYLSKDNLTKPIRVWARPEFLKNAQYALSIIPKLLEYYEEIFGLPYDLNKVDLVAIPDFASGAMENWGLITFRETALLYNETENSPRDKKNVAIDISHELAHQWFGNLVTMKWWTDLWLNEGFAAYIEHVGVDKVEPGWRTFESLSQQKMTLLRTDALKNTSPVSLKVYDASEISQKFDEISYTKGANLIRMLSNTITSKLFYKGLQNYLNKWKHSNAEENDLWASMTMVTQSEPKLNGVSVVKFMNSWTRQAGYPVVTVQRDYVTGAVKLTQYLFTVALNPYPERTKQIWQIPISYATFNSNFTDLEPKMWLNQKSTTIITNISTTEALYVNVDAIGYYRVNYDMQNWELLQKALSHGMVTSNVTRAQLIDDAFNLAKVGLLNYSLAFNLPTFVKSGEKSKIVWDILLNNLAFIKECLKATTAYTYFQDYVKTLLSKQLETLNYGLDKPKDDNEALLIENLLLWECYVESPRCLNWVHEQFTSWMNNKDGVNAIPNHLRSLVYSMAVKHGGRREFDFLWGQFVNSTDPNQKGLILSSLPYTREEGLVVLLLERSLSTIPKQFADSAWAVDSTTASEIAQTFMIDNWERVYRNIAHIDNFLFQNIISNAFNAISSDEELDRFKSFAIKNKLQLQSASQSIQKIVDSASLRINWIKSYVPTIEQWLKQYDEEQKPTVPVEQPSVSNIASTNVTETSVTNNSTNT